MTLEQGQSQLKAFIDECKSRQAALKNNPGAAKLNEPSASVASAAGDRVRLGQGPPSKTFEDLVTLAELKSKAEGFMTCLDKDDLDAVTESMKPGRKALQEILTLGNATSKDLKGAVTAAHKRVQQDVDQLCKRRKVTPATAPTLQIAMFEFVPVYNGNAKDMNLNYLVTGCRYRESG